MKIIISLFITINLLFYSTNIIASEEWITDEILKQLSEIKQELKALRTEITQLQASGTQNSIKLPERNVITEAIIGESAKIAIIEFSDYECPFCRRHYERTLPIITKEYIDTGKIQYVMRDFPLNFHPNALKYSITMRCIAQIDDDKYWDMHHYLFNNSTYDENSIKTELRRLGVDDEMFLICMNDESVENKIKIDMKYGQSIGVSGTPAFFIGKINGDKIVNVSRIVSAQDYSVFKNKIEQLLN